MMPEESRLHKTPRQNCYDGDKDSQYGNFLNGYEMPPELLYQQNIESITSLIHDASLNFSEEDQTKLQNDELNFKEISLSDDEQDNDGIPLNFKPISSLSRSKINNLSNCCTAPKAKTYLPLNTTNKSIIEAIEPLVQSNLNVTQAKSRTPDIATHASHSTKALNSGRMAENLFSGSFLISKPESSFGLLGTKDELLVKNLEEFINNLGCEIDTKLKIVTIFKDNGGSLADVLNQTFFFGVEIFKPFSVGGVWAAYNQDLKAVILLVDGVQKRQIVNSPNSWTLIKMMALSDVLIFYTQSEILHMISAELLGELSVAFMERYTSDLESLRLRLKIRKSDIGTLCPGLIILHETPLVVDNHHSNKKYVERIENRIREKTGMSSVAYSSISYLCKPTEETSSYHHVWEEVEKILADNKFRSPRLPIYIYRALEQVVTYFGTLKQNEASMFSDEFFTCRVHCEVCRSKCTETSSHKKGHCSHSSCKKSQKHSNAVMYCKTCYEKNDERVKVIPKMPPSDLGFFVSLTKMGWSGFILDCKNCGQIYKSQKYWYGNQGPEEETVTEYQHVWPDGERILQDDGYTGRRLIEQISQIGEVLANVSAAPIEAVSVWAADKTAPSYWETNNKPHCSRCGKMFDYPNNRHHCRKCGRCVCQLCSSKKKPVPEMGWGKNPVRVCEDCFGNPSTVPTLADFECKAEVSSTQLYPRKVSEYFTSTLDVLSTAIKYPLDAIKEGVRPAYWVRDDLIHDCCCCKRAFNMPVQKLGDPHVVKTRDAPLVVLKVHHCRGCGQGVCDDCSCYRPVESRGWDSPVRVCLKCNIREDL